VDSLIRRRLALVLSLLALAAVAFAACGDDDDEGSGNGGGGGGGGAGEEAETASGYRYAGTEKETEEARQAGQEDAGRPVDPPTSRSIGIIQLSGQSATSIAVTEAAREIAKIFGYDVNVCDPNFEPPKIPQCATSIVSQNPDVVFSVSQNPGPMGSGFRQAGEQGIPWFGTGSRSTPSRFMYDYGIDGFELAATLDKYMFEAMRERSDGDQLKLFAITAPTVGVASLNQERQLERDVGDAGDIELIKHNLDLANAVQDTLNTSRQTLEQNPDLAGMWTLCDFCLPLMAQTVGSKQPDERTTVVAGMFSNPETIADIREGSADAVADYPWDLPVWVGMDQALQNWARDKEIIRDFDVFESYSLPFMEPYVITADNAGDSGPAPIFGADYETYFRTKWAEEFGVDTE
jgi:ABC-type sugar transport system substrate-binding protein